MEAPLLASPSVGKLGPRSPPALPPLLRFHTALPKRVGAWSPQPAALFPPPPPAPIWPASGQLRLLSGSSSAAAAEGRREKRRLSRGRGEVRTTLALTGRQRPDQLADLVTREAAVAEVCLPVFIAALPNSK